MLIYPPDEWSKAKAFHREQQCVGGSAAAVLTTHYNLQVEANSKKNCTKKPMLFLVSMGKTGLSHDIFFEFSVRPFEVVEVE